MGKYYAVKNGRNQGVYNNWSDCRDQVHGFSKAKFKSFPTREAAEAYAGSNSTYGEISGGSYGGSYGSYGGSYGANAQMSRGSNRSRAPEASYYGGGSPSAGTRRQSGEPSRQSNQGRGRGGPQSVVYTDGSSLGNGKRGAKAGWASYWGPSDARNRAGPVSSGEQTNNRGELIAIHETLKTINREHRQGSAPAGGYQIKADSRYAQDSLDKWTKGWEANGWKTSTGGNVKNRDIIQPAYTLLNELRQQGVPIEIEHVSAHSGHAGNETADLMAREAAERS